MTVKLTLGVMQEEGKLKDMLYYGEYLRVLFNSRYDVVFEKVGIS